MLVNAKNLPHPSQDSSIKYWLALKLIPRLSIERKLHLVNSFGLAKLFERTPILSSLTLSEKQRTCITSPDWHKINAIIVASEQCDSTLIGFDDEKYPSRLKQIYDPPLVLFAQGNASLLQRPQLAIVGSRNTTVIGRENAFNFAFQLAKHNVVITSGLALGVDAAAHRGVLHAAGSTIAVVATGLDRVYPARHKKLANDIINQHGLIISEFLPGTPPKAGLFPRRNRLISGLCSGVLVVEATLKSGSLITARCAIEQNREVFALPGSINNPQSKGCHWLIKQGAKLVDDIADIMEELNISEKNGLNLAVKQDKDQELTKSQNEDLFNDPLLASVGYEITPVDTVVSRSKLPTEVVLTRLTLLELRGLVSAVPGGYLRLD